MQKTALKEDILRVRLDESDERLLVKMARGRGMTRSSLVRYVLRHFDEFQIKHIATLKLVRDILATLPPDHKDARIDKAFALYHQTLGKLLSDLPKEQNEPVTDLREIGYHSN